MSATSLCFRYDTKTEIRCKRCGCPIGACYEDGDSAYDEYNGWWCGVEGECLCDECYGEDE